MMHDTPVKIEPSDQGNFIRSRRRSSSCLQLTDHPDSSFCYQCSLYSHLTSLRFPMRSSKLIGHCSEVHHPWPALLLPSTVAPPDVHPGWYITKALARHLSFTRFSCSMPDASLQTSRGSCHRSNSNRLNMVAEKGGLERDDEGCQLDCWKTPPLCESPWCGRFQPLDSRKMGNRDIYYRGAHCPVIQSEPVGPLHFR